MDTIQEFLNRGISIPESGPSLDQVKLLVKKYYKKHLDDVIKQFKRDVKIEKRIYLKELDAKKFFNIEKLINKIGPEEDRPTSGAHPGILYYYSTIPTLGDKADYEKTLKLKNGIECWIPYFSIDLYVVKGKINSLWMCTHTGFDCIPDIHNYNIKNDHWYPGFCTNVKV